MPEYNRNIYKTAREAAGLTQEAAAEKLGLSVESIRAYETGGRMPPNMVVDLMVIAYNSQLLGIQHLRASGESARQLLPEVSEVPLPEAVMLLINAIYNFADKHRDRELISIAKDGVIDSQERPAFDAIVGELDDIIQAALALRCIKE